MGVARDSEDGSLVSEGRLIGSWYRFKDWCAPDPDSDALHESMWTAVHARERLTAEDALRLASAADAYCHFVGHPAATNAQIIEQLRDLRRAVKATRKAKATVRREG